MTAPRSLPALVMLVLVALAGPAMAAGALDGAYALTGGGGSVASLEMFVLVIQNGGTVLLVVLDPVDSSWTFGTGTLNADQQVEGLLYFSDVLEAGEFRMRFQGPNVTGAMKLFEFSFGFTGTKLF